MRRYSLIAGVVLALIGLALGARPAHARAPGVITTTVPVQMVVTVETNHGTEVPAVGREDVQAYQGHDRDEAKNWIPLQGDRARLELFVLLDDAWRINLAAQLEDLRKFIITQLPTTAIGLGYMRNSVVEVAARFTTDHAKVAKTARLPLGEVSPSANPYLSVADLIKRRPTDSVAHQVLMNRWPDTPVRHEILVVSDGIDRLGGTGLGNPYLDAAIVEAQHAGVIICAIYAGGTGCYGRSIRRINWGQNYLSQVAEETRGEAFYLGFETPISFTPYVDDLNRRLNHQFLLAFFARPENKAGLQRVKLRTAVPNAELVAAEKAYVPAVSYSRGILQASSAPSRGALSESYVRIKCFLLERK